MEKERGSINGSCAATVAIKINSLNYVLHDLLFLNFISLIDVNSDQLYNFKIASIMDDWVVR